MAIIQFSLSLLLSIALFKVADCNYELEVEARGYRNTAHKLSSGSCCEVHSTSNCNPLWCLVGCPDCDNYFRFCLRAADSVHDGDLDNCPLGYYSSGSSSVGDDSFTFGSSIGGIPNPFIFSGTILPPSAQLYIRVTDEDSLSSDDHVDDIYLEAQLTSPSSIGYQYYTGVYGNSEIELRFRVRCLEDFYGSDCSRYCVDTDSASGHYTCDANGNKICNDGWSVSSLSCTIAVCAVNCNPIGGSCDLPGDCNCNADWRGELCTECVPAQDCSDLGGYCNIPGECMCLPGFIGENCQIDTLVCEVEDRCVNDGVCVNNGVGGYSCQCPQGFSGHDCDIESNACTVSPCLNGGACSVNPAAVGYSCSCEPDWTGLDCEVPVHPCLLSDQLQCENGGICQVAPGGSTSCACPPGFTGPMCEIEMNYCQPDPCENQGTCLNGVLGFECQCPSGFEGEMCQTNHNDCLPSPCENRGTCQDMVNGYECSCDLGFTGHRCEIELDDCDPMPCVNDGLCFDGINEYTCLCQTGFTGRNCEMQISGCSNSPCQNDAFCTSVDANFHCECVNGYYGDRCELEIDECLTNPCGDRGDCVDLVADYRCDCHDDLTGRNCEVDQNQCRSASCVNGACINLDNDYICDCIPGYTGQDCQEVDDCASNPCSSPGATMCVDRPGSYICVCEPGYTGGNCGTVIDDPSTTASEPSLAAQGANIGGVAGGTIAGLVVLIIVLLLIVVSILLLKNRNSKSYVTSVFSVSSSASDEAFVNPTYSEASGLNIQDGPNTGNSTERDFTNPIYGSDDTCPRGPSLPTVDDPLYSDVQSSSRAAVYESIPTAGLAQDYNRLQREAPAEANGGQYDYITVRSSAAGVDSEYSTLDH